MLKTQINIHALFKITAGGGYGRNTQGAGQSTMPCLRKALFVVRKLKRQK